MEVFLTGGSGFIGRSLTAGLLAGGHTVTVLSRSQKAANQLPKGAGLCLGDPAQPGPWQERAARAGWLVNLAGASIFGRWTKAYKDLIRSSRVESTRNLVDAMALSENPRDATLVSASAVGYYGFCQDQKLDEQSPAGNDFLARICRQWEAEALRAEALGARVIPARFGVVLGPGGGALAKMLPIFKKGLGGPLGSGRQWFSWIHSDDIIGAIIHCLENDDISGAVNMTAPEPVRNRQFTKALAKALGKPAFLPAPGFAVKLAMGEFGSFLLQGQRVFPVVLERSGYRFRHPGLEAALAQVLP